MEPEEEKEKFRLPKEAVKLIFSFGLEGSRRNNVVYIKDDVLMHSCGNVVHFLQLSTKKQTFLMSQASRGIGAVALHPNKQCFAVCEKGKDPDVFVYAYPSLALKKTMKGGTERLFTAANFSNDGTQLATVGGHPDYWLTVWDWENETMILRWKAFSQEVFKVDFSTYFTGQLITSGVGHIRFWKMASTFTGLKLEGAIAKFGTVPISDVAGYVELRNSKVLSGTEVGTILVWDDGLIKAQLKRPGESIMCHDGMIEYITLNEDAKVMTTSGADGFIRFWNLDENGQWLDAANDGDDKLVCEINPTREINMGETVKIKGIICEIDHWILQDEGGALWKAKLPGYEMERVLVFHAGPITCVASSPVNYDLASSGSDGTVRLFHFKEHQQRYCRKFPGGVSSFLWLPLKVDPIGNSVVAGFTDGVVRILEVGADHWILSRAIKPHKSDITSLSFSRDGELMVTGSKDCTIFFFHCTNNYGALGFCKVPGPVTSMDWAPNGKHLLVGCHNGAIVEVIRPGVDGDTTKSFELILAMKAYQFRRPKIKKPSPKVVHVVKNEEPSKEGDLVIATGDNQKPSEAVATDQKSGAAAIVATNQKPEGGAIEEVPKGEDAGIELQDGAAQKSEGAPTEIGLDGKPIEGEGKPSDAPAPPPVVEDEEPDDPPGTEYPVRAIMYTNGSLGTFYVAFEGRASGYIYECHVDSEEVLGYTPWLECVKFMHFTHSSEFLISGSDDGVVRVQTVPPPSQIELAETSKYWEGGVHDGFYGVVGGAVLSYDEKFLASVSHDGSFFVQSIDMAMAPTKPPTKAQPAAKPEKPAAETEDVTAVALSIEEQRAKTEQDERLKLAMEKKNVVLAKVDVLRNNLAALLKEMNERAKNEKLPMEHFEIDPHVRIMLGDEEEREVDQAQKELQWDSEKRNVALRKLKAWYLDPLEVERIVLHAFMSGQVVSSFRTAKLSPVMQVAIADAKKQKGIRRWSKLERGQESVFFVRDKEGAEPIEEQKLPPDAEEEDLEAQKKKLEEVPKAEQRRLMLKIRDKEMMKYISTKPDEMWVSDDDAAAITYAENNKGDFKLKSDPLYVVPEDLRVNARLKGNEMLLFSEAIYLQKMAFNKEFLALRARKKALCEQIAKNNERVSRINNILKITNEVLFVPSLPKQEYPEDREVISLEEVREYEEKLKAYVEAALKANKTKDTLGMDQPTKKSEGAKSGPAAHKDRDLKSRRGQQQKDFKGFPLSPLELAEQEAQHTKLKYEKNMLLERNSSLISDFDNSLEDMRANRFNLEINIKAAELKMMALYQELGYLQKIQPTEESLDKRIHEKIKAVTDMQVKLEDQEKLMEIKKEEISLLVEKRQEIISEFDHIFPETDDQQKVILQKYFIKIIRRVKRNLDGTIADSDEESDLEETTTDADEDDYEDDDVVEVCPPNVTQFFYDQMFKLRERRVEQDWLIKEANKALDALTRERDNIIKKKKLSDASLETVEKEIAVFQKEKQYSLNEIDIVLSLKMHQIEHLENGALPEDLSRGIVFDNAMFQNLKDIIAEHMKEKEALKELHKELRKEHQLLNREKKTEDDRTVNIEARCVEVQMLKFGQAIDMEVLDVISKDMKKDTRDLKQQLRAQEANQGSELHKWNIKIEEATDELCSCTKHNSKILNTIADLKTKQNHLTTSMEARVIATLKDPLVENKKHASEHSRLCELIRTQDALIQKMQEEITHFRTDLDNLFPTSIDETILNRYSGLLG